MSDFATPMDLIAHVAARRGKPIEPNTGYGDDRSLEGGGYHPEMARVLNGTAPPLVLPPAEAPAPEAPPAETPETPWWPAPPTVPVPTLPDEYVEFGEGRARILGFTVSLNESETQSIRSIVAKAIDRTLKGQMIKRRRRRRDPE